MDAKHEGVAYLSSFVDAISKKLSSLLEHDSFLQSNDSALMELLERLEDCLADVEPGLDDAELKQFHKERVKKWLVDLQDALYMADDFLDELCTKAATATPRDSGNSYYWSRPVDLIIEDSGANVIQKIVRTLEYLVARKDKLGLEKSAKLDTSWRIPSTSLVVSSDIFGRDDDKENIIKLLLDDTCAAESPITVIPIVGMGGIGKTTLAQLVYSDAKVVEKFDIRVWVCVAENPDLLRVTNMILCAIDSSYSNTGNFDLLQTKLKEKLAKKTFLIVLDDVWHDGRDMWENFLKPFQCESERARILLTTRSDKVASVFAANNLHYQLGLLLTEACWSVFLKHSCISTNSKEYAILEPIGKKIVEKCKGLPLALKTLGGLLRNKFIENDWENILESEIWELSEDDSKIAPALRVSYHYLPSHLKRCFVYCSLFPENYAFEKEELILSWMAEDFILPKKNDTLENTGCAYFDELVARSFFQPSRTNGRLFVMHDLMHELATFFAGKFSFKLKEFGKRHMIDNKTRHLSYATNCDDSIKLFQEAYNGAEHMRTFIDFTDPFYGQSIDIENDSWLLQQPLGCLRVFSSSLFKTLPDSIGESIHLRYLNLSCTSIVTLPESICKLYNLQTLKLRDCKELEMLPCRMQDLVNLRYLDIRGVSRLKEMPEKMGKLNHLNFLSNYIVGKEEDNGIRELGMLNDLHGSFRISKLENVKNTGEALEANMGNKKHISSLELIWLSDGGIHDDQTEREILDKLKPGENLKELSIEGYRSKTFPYWLGLSCYSNMTKLTLNGCKNCCELPSLGQLPVLQHLEFSRLDGLEKIDLGMKNGSFQLETVTSFKSLEILIIEDMARWREWHFPVNFDGFPQLRILTMIRCPVLSGDLPAQLPALEELTIRECDELACSLPRTPKLQTLYVDNSKFTAEAKLDIVKIGGSQLAKSILEWLPCIQPPRVQSLSIVRSSAISISSDYLPASLLEMNMLECSKLTFSEQLQHESLREILVGGCDSLTVLPLGALPNLKELNIVSCQSMEYIEVTQALPSLRSVAILGCPSLVSLPALGLAAPHLHDLRIENCPEIDCISRECLPPSLNSLAVKQCQKLARWIITSKGLQNQGLTRLKLDGWSDVKSFPSEGCLPASLEYLQFMDFPNLETLHCKGFQDLTSLQDLLISDCENLKNITEQHLLASIKRIHIGRECPLRRNLEDMKDPSIKFTRYYVRIL